MRRMTRTSRSLLAITTLALTITAATPGEAQMLLGLRALRMMARDNSAAKAPASLVPAFEVKVLLLLQTHGVKAFLKFFEKFVVEGLLVTFLLKLVFVELVVSFDEGLQACW